MAPTIKLIAPFFILVTYTCVYTYAQIPTECVFVGVILKLTILHKTIHEGSFTGDANSPSPSSHESPVALCVGLGCREMFPLEELF